MGDMLGKGSQGKVHLCVDKETGQQCAVKIIDRSARTAWATYRREVDLCKAAAEVPNVVRVLDEFVDSCYCYVVMEKYTAHLRKGLKHTSKESGGGMCLEYQALRRIVQQALAAISHLHQLEIVHRDVKAQNFLTDRLNLKDEQTYIVLSDFGLARRLQAGHVLSAQVGTRKYWPPDIYNKKYWHVVDVFAIGVLMFLASSGTYPYADEPTAKTRDIFAEGAVPEGMHPEAVEFMRVCLEKEPAKRPSALELLAHPYVADFEEGSTRMDVEQSETAISSSAAFSPSFAFGGKLGRTLAVPIPVPRGDIADHLEASDLEDALEACVLKSDGEEHSEVPSETTCGAEEGASSPFAGLSPLDLGRPAASSPSTALPDDVDGDASARASPQSGHHSVRSRRSRGHAACSSSPHGGGEEGGAREDTAAADLRIPGARDIVSQGVAIVQAPSRGFDFHMEEQRCQEGGPGRGEEQAAAPELGGQEDSRDKKEQEDLYAGVDDSALWHFTS